jgi:O-acetyl-ADP-ribose deacetylase (regulator of RNase III)
MKYLEMTGDLFNTPPDYALAHCISADCKMGAGIAVKFQERFRMRRVLLAHHPKVGTCIPFQSNRIIFNLITKEFYYQKPTLETLTSSLIDMKRQLSGCEKVAMPTIGCGLDKLKWNQVKSKIMEVFQDTNVEILVVFKGG